MATCEYDSELYECSFSEKYILPACKYFDQSAIADFIKDSLFIVPWAGVIHLLSIALLGGAILMVDMRVLGSGIRSQTPHQINQVVRPITIAALALAILSGATMAFGELMKLYYSPPYWMKMGSLAGAILFTYGVRNRAIKTDATLGKMGWVLAGISLTLWIGTFTALSNTMAQFALLLLLIALGAFAWFGRDPINAAERSSIRLKLISAASIVMWLTTAAAGRWIAFY